MTHDRDIVLAFDFGTGGCKASAFDPSGTCLAACFKSYDTSYPHPGFHEQKPNDWWTALCACTTELFSADAEALASRIRAIGISGHSLAMVPLDASGQLVLHSIPIWSDSRPGNPDLDTLFSTIPQTDWYNITGNGFPPALYTVFKLIWLRRQDPELFDKIDTVLGTKDYINYMLTGQIATDHSYASGSGIYDLRARQYSDVLVQASGLPRGIFPEIVDSADIVGPLKPEIASQLGLPTDVVVVAGGVDNACMALGANCVDGGASYMSLGSSSWIAVASDTPILDTQKRPFVFAHCVPGRFVSATAIFAAGSCLRWLREVMAPDLSYAEIVALADAIPVGSDGLMFNPSLAGGSSLDKSPDIRGGFVGLTLGHNRAHMARAVLEGVAMGLRTALDVLERKTPVQHEMLVVGGGGKSALWRQILADCFDHSLIHADVDEQTAALGAAALALVGSGIWSDVSQIASARKTLAISRPLPESSRAYAQLQSRFADVSDYLSDDGCRLA